MLHAQALVRTDTPSLYAASLVHQLSRNYATEWSAEAGFIHFPDASCDMHAWPEGLRLDAYADNEASLVRMEQLISKLIESSAGAELPTVEWYLRQAT